MESGPSYENGVTEEVALSQLKCFSIVTQAQTFLEVEWTGDCSPALKCIRAYVVSCSLVSTKFLVRTHQLSQ